VLGKTLGEATELVLQNGKSPSRKVNELDNRGSHFYLALYWAQALAAQTEDTELATKFTSLAKRLTADEAKIVDELNGVQGQPMDVGGYYYPSEEKVRAAMRPSQTFNDALAELS
jgi:isocitrate dehydrogenase